MPHKKTGSPSTLRRPVGTGVMVTRPGPSGSARADRPPARQWAVDRQAVARVAAKALPNLVIAAAVPALCFLVGRRLWGLNGAIGLALVWNGSCQAARRLLGKPFSGLLVIGSIGLVLRASIALALSSAHVFFIVPAIVTAITGTMYVASGFKSSRLLALVVADLVPESTLDVTDARVARLMRIGSVLYGAEQLLIALVSIVMVINLSTTAYVALHPLVSWAVLALVIGAALPFFQQELKRDPGRRLLPGVSLQAPHRE
jgi:hypothetical protein